MATTIMYDVRCRRPGCGSTRSFDRAAYKNAMELRAAMAEKCECGHSMTLTATRAVDIKSDADE